MDARKFAAFPRCQDKCPVADDLVPMEKSLAELVASGTVPRDEAARYSSSPEYLDDLIKVRRERGHR